MTANGIIPDSPPPTLVPLDNVQACPWFGSPTKQQNAKHAENGFATPYGKENVCPSGTGSSSAATTTSSASKSRAEVEMLLTNADKFLLESGQGLDHVVQVSKTLLENSHTIRSKHDAIMARMPLPYLVHKQSVEQLPSTPSPSKRSQSATSPSWSSPPGSLRMNSSKTAAELLALGEANYQLTVQLTELEANTERVERDGKKKLRKLEKELSFLREELMRSEQRTQNLEESQKSLAASVRRPPLAKRNDQQTQEPPVSPRSVVFPQAAASACGSESRPVAGEHPGKVEEDGQAASPKQDDLVNMLVAKLDELQFANETFASERDALLAKLAQAQNEVDDFKRQCEDLEDIVEMTRDEAAPEQTVEPQSPESPRRARGNQSMINAHKRGHKRFSSVSFSVPDTEFGGLNRASISRRDSRGHSRTSSDVRSSRRQTLDGELRQSWVSGTAASSIFDNEPFGSPRALSDMTADTTTNLIPTGSLLDLEKPDPDTYEAINAAVDGMPAVWEDEDDFGHRPPPRPSRRQLRSVQWAHEGQHVFPESESPERLRIEAAPSVRRPHALRRRSYRPGHRHSSMILEEMQWETEGISEDDEDDDDGVHDPLSHRTMSRREMALRRLELATAYDHGLSDEEEELERDHGLSHDYSDDEEYEHVSTLERTRGDYYPMTLRARYHPRMVVQRATDSLVEQAAWVAMYARFFAVLALAVAFALWQGPQKSSMAKRPNRKRIE